MAVTEGSLYIMAALAMVCTLTLFVNIDRATKSLLSFLGAVIWGLFAMSSFDVLVVNTYAATRSEPIMPLVYIGVVFALLTFIMSLLQLFKMLSDEARATKSQGLIE